MNDKQKSILKRFLLFILLFAIVCLVGISNIFALETKTIYSTNSSGTLSNSNKYTYGFINTGGVQTTSSASVNTTVNGRALALIYYMYEPVILNKTYTMEINFMSNDLISTFTSSMVEVATCNADVCNDNAIVSVIKSSPSGMSNKLTIQFNPITTGSILMVNLSDKTREFYITGLFNQQTFGIKSVKLESTNQNQDIIDNQTNNTNNIINNNNSNTQEIINNQNQNTQDIIEANKVCNNYGKNDYKIDNKMLISDGRTQDTQNFGITNYILIEGSTVEALAPRYNTTSYSCFYDSNKTLVSCFINSSSGLITIPDDARYVRFTVYKFDNSPLFKVCTNGNQSTNNAINDLNSNLTDDTPVDMNSLGNVAGWLPPGPIDSIINLPLSMLNALYSAMQGTCAPLHIPIPYLTNKYLDIPCLSYIFSQIEGLPTFWNWVGLIASTLMLYRYLLALYKYYDDLTTLQANFISDFGGAP